MYQHKTWPIVIALVGSFFLQCVELFAHGAVHERIVQITKEISRNPNDALLYLRRGELYYHHSHWTAALSDFDSASVLDPSLSETDFYRGKTLMASGDLRSSREALSRFLSKHPENAQAVLWYARVLSKLAQHEMAAKSYDRFFELRDDPQPEHYLERAQVLVGAGEEYIQRALRGLDQGLTNLGQIVTLQLLAMDLEVKLGRFEAALRRLKLVSAQSARQEKWQFRRAQILKMAGREQEAQKCFRLALESIASLPTGKREAKAIKELETKILAELQ